MFLTRLLSFFTGANLIRWIEITIVTAVIMFVSFLWISRAHALDDLAAAQKSNVEANNKLAQITSDIQAVRIKQELAEQQRDDIKKQTDDLIKSVKNQKLPTNCKDLVKWAAKNKGDTKW